MIRRTMLALAAAAFVAWSVPVLAEEEEKAGTHEGKVVKVETGKLTMSDKDGKNQHTHAVPADAKITLDGKEAKLDDLKAGQKVKVTTEKKGDKIQVVKIEASKD
jgi:Cu/Ag efflux protein CusF